MNVKRFSDQEQAEVEQLIRSNYLSYPQIAARYGVSRFRINNIAIRMGIRRPRGTASLHHRLGQQYRAAKETSNGNV